ncbi:MULTISPECIES: hypothetical protein [unclassified Myroides]|uniref:hypothetical protein n=1 Tax=unclassified Myroides TaxID=2642485 RepID=UPI003D2F7ED5
MKKHTHLLAFAFLSLCLTNCSSDDSTVEIKRPVPTYEKQYFISQVQTSLYTKEFKHETNGSYEILPILEQENLFQFTYTEDYKLQTLRDVLTLYKDAKPKQTYAIDYNFELDENDRLKTLEKRMGNTLINHFAFTYKDNLLHTNTVQQEGETLELTFVYNQASQFTSALIKPYSMKFDYAYNDKNQMISMGTLGLSVEFGYTEEKNPFSHLPFDMTTLLLEELSLIPLTYHFPNLIQTLVSPEHENFTIEYTFNEDLYPVKATMYEMLNKKKVVYKEFTYTYAVQEIEITKPLN